MLRSEPFPTAIASLKQCSGDLAASGIHDGANRKPHVSVREGHNLQRAYPHQVNAQSKCQPLGGGYSRSQAVKAAWPPGHHDALYILYVCLALLEETNQIGNEFHSMILPHIPGDLGNESASTG
ncbi:MAG: hypothetical protein DDT25_01354 [Chloroflexi bacterium]|nr:hypothetical protein [Chloroflexota bacterium]